MPQFMQAARILPEMYLMRYIDLDESRSIHNRDGSARIYACGAA